MDWLEVRIDTTHDGLEPVEAMLSGLGIDNIAVSDEEEFRGFLEENRAAWDYVDGTLEREMRGRSRVTFYLPKDDEGYGKLGESRIALQALKDARTDLRPLLMTLENVRDADWENNWKQYYKPLNVGQRLLIVPEWEQAAVPADRVSVVLDPGLAFGTGNHDTTRLCLELMEPEIRGGERVLDAGCGSGILSIAAVKLGARSVTAVDMDRVAVRAAQENAERNNIGTDTLKVLYGNLLTDPDIQAAVGGGYDLILANIVADVIMGLAPRVPGMLAPGGRFVCSGIIDSRIEDVQAALRGNGLEILETRESGGWYACRCRAD